MTSGGDGVSCCGRYSVKMRPLKNIYFDVMVGVMVVNFGTENGDGCTQWRV